MSLEQLTGTSRRATGSFVTILMAMGIVILLFAVINYVNLTAAQTGFRAKEMATRRLLGATKGEVVLKLILESTFLMCCAAFAVALSAGSRGGARRFARLLGVEDRRLAGMRRLPSDGLVRTRSCVALGVVAGFVPATTGSRATNPWTSCGDRSATAPRGFTARC